MPLKKPFFDLRRRTCQQRARLQAMQLRRVLWGSVYGLSRTALRQVLQPPGVSTLQLAQLLWQGLGGDASLCQTICSQPPRLNSRTQ